MTTLVIETATAACSVALIDGAEILASTLEMVGRGHAERLVPMIGECVGGRAPPVTILVDCGPGSFTGVRVGLAAARALGFGWGAEVRGFSSMDLLAIMAGDGALAVAMTGGHGEVFIRRYADRRAIDALRSLTPGDAADHITESLIVGSGAMAVVEARGWGEARALLPEAARVARVVSSLPILPPTPLYGRAPDAKLPG